MGKEEQREPGAGRRLLWCPVGRGASGMSRGRAGHRGSADWRWSTQRERGSPEWVRSPGSVGRKEREGLGEGPSGRVGEGRGEAQGMAYLQSQSPGLQEGGRGHGQSHFSGHEQNATRQGVRGGFGLEDSPGMGREGTDWGLEWEVALQ